MEHRNLWAPWRIGYIQAVGDNSGGCFLCRDVAHPENDDANLVVRRSALSIVVLNRFPYNNGHLLVAPIRHIADLGEATDEELLDLMREVRAMQRMLSLVVSPHGFNVGINLGRCAGAGLPGHLHVHVVPRWNGDTNFMTVCGDAKVINQGLAEMLEQLKLAAKSQDRT